MTHVPPGWNDWQAIISGHYLDYKLNENGTVVGYDDDRRDYQTDVLGRKAVDIIRGSAGQSPFFIHLSTFASHRPLFPARRHRKALQDLKAPKPPSFDEADLSDKPGWVRNKGPLREDQIAEIDERFRERLKTLLAVDDLIRDLIAALEESNQLNNTYIFYASDNGFEQGEHRITNGKNTPYEESIRIPLIVRGPGVPAGQTKEHLISNIDLAPTFAKLGKAEIPEFVDGLSFQPLLESNAPAADAWRSAILIQHWSLKGAGEGIPDYRGVRAQDHVYVEYGTGERELYDLRSDPYQLESQHEAVASPVRAEMEKMLRVLEECAGVACTIRGPEVPFIQIVSPNGGEDWPPSSTQSIEWTSTSSIVEVTLEYSTDNCGSWLTLAASTPNDGHFLWQLPDATHESVLLRVSDALAGEPSDLSDAPFSISASLAIEPIISSFTPTTGPIGTRVTVSGKNLGDVTEVSFGGVPALDISVVSAEVLFAVVPEQSSTGPIAVTTRSGKAVTVVDFTVTKPEDPALPRSYSFAPTDDGFVRSSRPEKNYGSSEELRVRKSNSSQIITFFKFHVNGTEGEITEAKLRVLAIDPSDDGGTVYSMSNYLKNSSVEWAESTLLWTNAPDVGSTGFSKVAEVAVGQIFEFDLTAAISGNGVYSFAIQSTSRDAVKYASKEHVTTGKPELVLTTSSGGISLPIVTSISPASGEVGSEVTISGEYFREVSSVSFSNTSAPNFRHVAENEIAATVPAGATTGQITITSINGIARSLQTFTVTTAVPAPIITEFDPKSGPVGLVVTLTGSNFTDASEVRFGEVRADDFSVESDSEVRVVVPDATTSSIQIITKNGSATTGEDFVVIVEKETGPQELTFVPTDDASAWQKRPTRNYSIATDLRVRQSRRAKAVAYFKFTVAGLNGEIAEAILRFLVKDGSNDGGSVYAVSNDFADSGVPWTEAELIWENAPSLGGDPLDSIGSVSAGDTIEFDVTKAITGRGVVSFAVANRSGDAMMLSSKEGVQAPELIVRTKSAPLLAKLIPAAYEARESSETLVEVTTMEFFPNYPNPFNPETNFQYSLPEATNVNLVIYNILGGEVRTLVNQYQMAGLKTARWDGWDNFRRPVSSGIYFARLRVGNQILSRRILLQR